ncbi:unnamed protein product [Ilex paraguariensis]
MAELKGIDNLVAAREVLRSSLEKSRNIAFEIRKSGPKLEMTIQTLPSLEAAIKDIARKCDVCSIRTHIDRVVGPAAAVLKVFDAVRELENLVSADPCSNLFGYLSNVKRLEEALKFLTDNCQLVILWLEDVEQFLEDKAVSEDWYILNVKKSLRILQELKATEEHSRFNGGLLNSTFNKLENEFRRLLAENSFPVSMASTGSSLADETCTDPLLLPLPVICKLQAIIERLTGNNRLEKCISIYVEIRSLNAQTTLQALDLDYLEMSISEFDSVQTIEGYIDQWGKHLEFAVKHLLELEYRLCNDVFQNFGSDVSRDSFAKIAVESGMQNFIRFGSTVTKCKKEAVKLFKLLDIFTALNKLRLDFNRLFGGKACIEIQNQTRDLIKKIVNGASEIFWELSSQVELQRHSSPPSDGSIPRLVSFVTDYCNQLLEDDYRSTLIQVLEIHRGWNHEKYEEGLLSEEVYKIIRALELNLEKWANTYEDSTLSYLFMMNNRWYFCKNLKGTKLGDLLGDSWFRGHEEYVEYYAALYLRESWGKLPALLSEEGLILFSSGRAIARDLVKKRLKAFNEVFDDMYKKQSNWVLSDKGLRWKTCQLVVQIIVPLYKSYMQNYMHLMEQGGSPSKCVKYSAESLENMLSSLFQPKLGKYGSTKCTHLIGKIKDVVYNHFSSTPAAA